MNQPTGDDNQALQTLPRYAPDGGQKDTGLYKPDMTIGRIFEAPAPDPYAGIAAAPFSPEAQAILLAPLTDSDIAIRPDDGNLYLPQVKYRARLNKAFGVGGWGIRPKRDVQVNGQVVFYEGQLYVLGRFVAEAMGKGTWIANNAKSDYGTALESAKSDSLTRCCKDLGVAAELWDPVFANVWRGVNCIEVRNPDVRRFGSRAVKVWVRRDDPCLAEHQAPNQNDGPNLPKLSTNRETGRPIVGSWPKAPWVDPSAQGAKELDDQFRRTMGAAAQSDLEVQLQRSIDSNTIEVIDKRTGVVTKETKATGPQIARIHILQREMSISDESYRGGLVRYYGVSTSALLTKAQAEDAILRLERTKAKVPREMLRAVPDADEPPPSEDNDDCEPDVIHDES